MIFNFRNGGFVFVDCIVWSSKQEAPSNEEKVWLTFFV